MSNKSISSLETSLFKGLISQPRLRAIQTARATKDEEKYAEELRQQIITKLLKKNAGQSITTLGDVLMLTPTALLRILDPCLTYVECRRLIARIRQTCAIQPVNALDVMRRKNYANSLSNGKLSTGLPNLDNQLRGGFPVGSITEIVGRAGAGKTHLSQQLCVLAASSGDGGTIYIDTENKMSVVRLKELALESSYKRRKTEITTFDRRNPEELVLENVTVHSSRTTRELLDVLNGLEEEIILRNDEADECRRSGNEPGSQSNVRVQRLPVRLLIVDSIAAPLRLDYASPNSAVHRASAIFEIAQKLKQLADNYQFAVVVTNQVGGGYGRSGNGQRNDSLDMNDGEFTGSLGTVWQHCISTRVVLEHNNDPNKMDQGRDLIRIARITKSLLSKNAQFNFEVTQQGVLEVRDKPNEIDSL